MRRRRGRQFGRASRWRQFEFLEPRLALTGFTAYNGLYASGSTHENTTFYADLTGHDAAGPLIDIETGQETEVLLTTSQVGVNFGGNGSNPALGTDAHEIFDGFVDLTAGAERSLEIESNDAYQYTFENLDSGATYDFAGTAIRGNPGYTDRWTLVEIEGAESLTPAHSSGLGMVVAGLPPNQVAIWTGHNGAADQGYVAQWLEIDPGDDGIFHVVSTQYRGPVPSEINSSGVADGSKGYGLAAIRLIENVPAGPPAVENTAATDVMAFQAALGGRISTTGGQVPDVKIYYGMTDGGTSVDAWQHNVSLGKVSREFSTIVDGLSSGTTYFFRAFAENTLGNAWASSSETFTTRIASPPVVENLPADSVGAFAAILAGQVVDVGNDLPLVTLYYGPSDGGTNAAAWKHAIDLGIQSGSYSAPVLSLEPLTQYYFTAYAQNTLGGDWASNSLSFVTTEMPPLQVNEFMADNATTLTTRVRASTDLPFRGDTLTPDWIELHNPTGQVADLGGYHLTDDLNDPQRWQIPAGTWIPAGGYLVVFASGLDLRDPRLDERGNLHTNFALRGSSGDDLALTDASGEVVFALTNTPLQSEDISYGIDLSATPRFFGVPTPGESNANDRPQAPRVSVPSRTFTGSIEVEMIPSLSTQTIHYTLNEQIPTTASPVYTGPLTISSTTQLRAIAVSPDGKSSVVVSEAYLQLASDVLNHSSNLPLLIVESFGDGVPGSTFGDVFVGLIEPGESGRSQLTDSFDVATRAGIHVRGSSSSGFSKKQYRVEFWDEQNEDRKLEVLGMPREADWIFYGPGPYDRVLISNPLMFDLSNQIGRYATRTRWVEMYLNANGGTVSDSDYVGVYAIVEVVEQGDDRVDVESLTTGAGGLPVEGGFVWKNDRGSAYVDPEMTTSAQRSYIDGWINGLATAAAGPNFKDPNLGYAKYADVDSFIDHNILNLLSMNVDALRLSSYYYKSADGKLEAGPIWDFDRSLDSTDGRDNNPRTWFGTGDSTRYFDDSDRVMSWWPDMFQDPDFVQRYIDRWAELRQQEFHLDNLNATIDAHAAELSEAAPRDYRRWSASRFGDFAGEVRHLKDWLRQRIEWIDSQWLAAPQFSLSTPQVPVGTSVSLSASQGQIYYTLDGADPRGENGTIRAGAQRVTGPIPINGFTRIVARVFQQGHGPTTQGYIPSGDDWSAPVVGIYYNDPPASSGNLAVSEINYHPHPPSAQEEAAGFDDGDDFEFIELVNPSDKNVVLTGAKLVAIDQDGDEQGVNFDFANSPIVILAPQERILVVEDLEAFQFRYGDDLPVAGEWQGGLQNSSEQITLLALDGSVIQQFAYRDDDFWPSRADGIGSSLEALNPLGNLADPRNWQASVDFGGTPGRVPGMPIGVVINEILAHTDPPLTPSDSIELLNLTAGTVDLSGWYLSDSDQQFLKFRIPDGTKLQSGEYIVFDEDDFNPTPATPEPHHFALSSARGDDVWLVTPDGQGGVRQFVDDVHFPATLNGESMGRVPDGTGGLTPLLQRSLGEVNGEPRVGPIIVSELNYNPGPPSADALTIDPGMTADDLEYVEIANPTAETIDLTEWRIRGGVDYDFEPGTYLPAGGTLVVIAFNPGKPENASRLAAFRMHYGIDATVPLVGGYSGRLRDAGETVRLQRPDEPPAEDPLLIPRLLEDQVTYEPVGPWPDANGSGRSLTRISTSAFGEFASSWQAAEPSPGRSNQAGDVNGDGQITAEDVDVVCDGIRRADPGFDFNSDNVVDQDDLSFFVESILQTSAGDANVDRRFDAQDFVQVFQEGEYEDGVAGNSTWGEGDWNCDGEFDTADMVVAFQAGRYETVAATAGSSVPRMDLAVEALNTFSSSFARQLDAADQRFTRSQARTHHIRQSVQEADIVSFLAANREQARMRRARQLDCQIHEQIFARGYRTKETTQTALTQPMAEQLDGPE